MAKFITNKERQKELDKEKWLESERIGFNCSGSMYYCNTCDKEEDFDCKATQAEREEKTLCAKAYNKHQRNIRATKNS